MGGSYVQQTALYGASPSLLRWHTAGLLQLWSLNRRRMGRGAAAEEEGSQEERRYMRRQRGVVVVEVVMELRGGGVRW